MTRMMSIRDTEQIKKLLALGYRHTQIARRMGCHCKTVWRIAKKNGIKMHGVGRPRSLEDLLR